MISIYFTYPLKTKIVKATFFLFLLGIFKSALPVLAKGQECLCELHLPGILPCLLISQNIQAAAMWSFICASAALIKWKGFGWELKAWNQVQKKM